MLVSLACTSCRDAMKFHPPPHHISSHQTHAPRDASTDHVANILVTREDVVITTTRAQPLHVRLPRRGDRWAQIFVGREQQRLKRLWWFLTIARESSGGCIVAPTMSINSFMSETQQEYAEWMYPSYEDESRPADTPTAGKTPGTAGPANNMATFTAMAAEAGSLPTLGMELLDLDNKDQVNTFISMTPHMPPECAPLFASLQKCLQMRDKYMNESLQANLYDNPKNWDAEYCAEWAAEHNVDVAAPAMQVAPNSVRIDGCAMDTVHGRPKPWRIYPPPPRPHWEQFSLAPTSKFVRESTEENGTSLHAPLEPASHANVLAAQELLESCGGVPGVFRMEHIDMPPKHELDGADVQFGMVDGVFHAWTAARDKCLTHVTPSGEWFHDLDILHSITSDGPAKTFAWRRLKFLEGKWNLYKLLNEYRESDMLKRVSHRDFYNVRKVDTHVHHSASMNQKHLLRFIKAKIKRHADDVVLCRDGEPMTLHQVFQLLGLTAYDLSIDTLDMHAHMDSFHRFDRFNLKYNPIGESKLREIFLKTDNYIRGRYLAEITREVTHDLEQNKYQMCEYRISIYGRNPHEWDKLAAWVVDHHLFSPNVRWLIQVPRLYDVYKANGNVQNFEELLDNVFRPLFEVTSDPASHPKLHIMLQRVVGFDIVDDESKPERRFLRQFPPPKEWNFAVSPPYSYWLYYMYANLATLNQWRRIRCFNTLVLRPHAGEAGDPDHLAAAYLTSQSISHGILLRKVPVLQYLYYLKQIPLAMSPLSNNALFLAYERNPFPDYFRKGLVVTLSTDDPLQFHLSKEPLLEEYSVATQIYKLSSTDMCELARNSVIQSGWEMEIKRHWLGRRFFLPGPSGNDVSKTNVPDMRLQYRNETLKQELAFVWQQ